MKLSENFETQRKEIWIEVWSRTAQASNTRRPESCTCFADTCLEEFDKRFKKIEKPEITPKTSGGKNF